MANDFATAFARCYRGRHDPRDALHWIDHPGQPGPSGAAPVQDAILRAEEHLRSAGAIPAADDLLLVLVEMLSTDRRAALDAVREASASPAPPTGTETAT